MNSKALVVLAAVTLIILVVGVLAYSRRDIAREEPDSPLLYPELKSRINDVARVEIESAEHGFTLESDESGQWGLADKSSYPVEFETVKSTLFSLTQLEVVEVKTSDAARYGQIGVADPHDEGSTGKRITLFDDAGDELASLIVGNETYHGRTPRHFVRRSGESESWLVEGRLPLDDDPMQWLDREILRVPHDRIQSARIMHPGDEPEVYVHRETKAQTNFTVENIPDGFELIHPTSGNVLRSAIGFLRFDDVVPATEREHDPETLIVSEFRTFDGLYVTVRTSGDGEDVWATFEGAVGEDEPDDLVTDPGADADGETDDLEIARSDAADLNDRCLGWIFKLGPGQAANLRKTMSELIKAVEPPDDPETGNGGDDGAVAPVPTGSESDEVKVDQP